MWIFGFSAYTGKVANELLLKNAVSKDECTITTKTVMGLLQRTRLLDSYRCVLHLTIGSTSFQLLDQMYERKTLRKT